MVRRCVRATGNTAPLKNGGTLEKAAAMANHASTRTTQLYDRRRDELSLDASTHVGLRDRALIGLMVYSFARIGAAVAMKVEDVYVQHRRLWVRLHEKGGKRHEMPCHHSLEAYLHGYLDGTGIASDPKGPLFRTI